MLCSSCDRVFGEAGRSRWTTSNRPEAPSVRDRPVIWKVGEAAMKSTLFAGVAAAALLVGSAAPSHAMLMLTVSDGTTTDTVNDLSNSGGATFMGAIGAFNFNVVTGTSMPLIGSAALPTLDLNSIDITSRGGSGGTLTFKLTDTDYIGVPGTTHF